MNEPSFILPPPARVALRRMGIILCLAVAASLSALPLQAQERREVPAFKVFGTPAHSADAADVDALLRAYDAAWRAQDATALMRLHADDVEWINAYARMFRGTWELGEFLEKRLFPAMAQAVSVGEIERMKPISIRYLGDAVVAHFYTESGRGVSRNEGETLRRTHVHLVLARQGQEWKIVHSAVMDAR